MPLKTKWNRQAHGASMISVSERRGLQRHRLLVIFYVEDHQELSTGLVNSRGMERTVEENKILLCITFCKYKWEVFFHTYVHAHKWLRCCLYAENSCNTQQFFGHSTINFFLILLVSLLGLVEQIFILNVRRILSTNLQGREIYLKWTELGKISLISKINTIDS